MQVDTTIAPTDDHDNDDGTPGWDAINAALARLYPGQEPRHFGSALPWTLGGDNPLDGISVYWSEQPRPHWHYVTYGLSELFGKESEDAQVSGFGFELTFRLAVPHGATRADVPPAWPMNLLQNLARYVFESGNVFEQGHHMNANGPIALDHDTVLRHVAFMQDPQLAPRDTPNGRLQFLQVIGLADGEMAAIMRWCTEQVLKVLEPGMPLWITDLDRGDLLRDPALAAQVDEGSLREGSSTTSLFVETLEWSLPAGNGPVELVLGAGQVPSLLQLLPMRLPFGETLDLVGRERRWTFVPGDRDGVVLDGAGARCTLSAATLRALLATLAPRRGTYALPEGSGLVVEVRPTQMRDGKGNPVDTIG